MGTALALALSEQRYDVCAMVTRRRASLRKAIRLLPQVSVALTSDEVAGLPKVDLILIATPDDAIATAAEQLAGALSSNARSVTVLHTSGALSSAELQPLAAIGCNVGSIHPLISVSDPKAGAADLKNAYFCLEGDRSALRIARQLVDDLGATSFSIKADQKALYHAAAVMSSGHVTALFDITIEMLVHAGLTNDEARRILLPLLESTWKNLARFDPADALTGTFARGDEATVQKHLAALTASDHEEALAIYRLLGLRSLELFAEKGGDKKTIERLREIVTPEAD